MSNLLSLSVVVLQLVSLASEVVAIEQVDPMRPDNLSSVTKGKKIKAVASKKPVKVSFWLQSVKIGDEQRSATINGKRMKTGDKISGARLIAIDNYQVQLRRGGRLIKLRFLPRSIK